jgi:hypothetical protein
MNHVVTPPIDPMLVPQLSALRSRRDALEGQAHELKVRVKELRSTLLGQKRREREETSAQIIELKALRASLDAQVEALNLEVAALMRRAG